MVRATILCLLSFLLLPGCTSLMSLVESQREEPADAGFQRVEQLPEGPQAQTVVGDFRGGLRNVTVVEWTYDLPYPLVWEACKTASARFREMGSRPIVKVSQIDERTARIQHGQVAEQATTGPDTAEWDDEFLIEVVSVSDAATKVVISRKIVRYDERGKTGGKTWTAQWSNGKIEWWLMTQIRDEVEKRKHLQAVAPAPPVPVRRPAPPAPAPTDEGLRFTDTVSVETIKVPLLEVQKQANVRAKPTTKSSIITTLEKGYRVEVLGKLREWYRIKMESGRIGWIHRQLVRQVE